MPSSRPFPQVLLALLAVLAMPLGAQQPATAERPRPDINAQYRDPKLRVDAWVERLESEGREAYDLRHEIVAAMGLEPGQVVADIGAGTGLFEPLLAAAVGTEGRVYAVDIAPKFVEHITVRARERGLTQIVPVLGADDSIRLPPASVDVMFVCDAYHHFEDYSAMLASMHRALRPGGRLYVFDFDRVEGRSSPWVLEHVRAGKERFTAEIEAAGFRFVGEIDLPGMRESFMRRFERPRND